jgi:hypothetical protein
LKETWLNKMKDIIKNKFTSTSADNTRLAGFSLNVASKAEFEQSDLKRFLTQ